MKDYPSFSNLNTDQFQKLLECMAICKACAKMCIEEGNKKTALICHECADICELSCKFKCCDSEFIDQTLKLCADICKKCANECDKVQMDHCRECATACKRCSDACSTLNSKR